jgi:hypothetical protein
MTAKGVPRIKTQLMEALNQIDELVKEGDKKPSMLKAIVTKATILHSLHQEEESKRAAKKAAKLRIAEVIASREPTVDELIAQVNANTKGRSSL